MNDWQKASKRLLSVAILFSAMAMTVAIAQSPNSEYDRTRAANRELTSSAFEAFRRNDFRESARQFESAAQQQDGARTPLSKAQSLFMAGRSHMRAAELAPAEAMLRQAYSILERATPNNETDQSWKRLQQLAVTIDLVSVLSGTESEDRHLYGRRLGQQCQGAAPANQEFSSAWQKYCDWSFVKELIAAQDVRDVVFRLQPHLRQARQSNLPIQAPPTGAQPSISVPGIAQPCPATVEFAYGGFGDRESLTYSGGELTHRNITINGPVNPYGKGAQGLENAASTYGYSIPAVREWAACHLRSLSSLTQSSQEIDTITPQVPGCPKYLAPSLVTWRRIGNPQLNTWEIKNTSRETLKVTYREGGVNGSPDTLPPGGTTQVSTSSSQRPSYVVRSFSEMTDFTRANLRKSLQCDLAIRPRN